MTSLHDRPNTALVVIDVQNDVVANAHDRDLVVGNIAALVDQGSSGATCRSSGCSIPTTDWHATPRVGRSWPS